MGLLYFLYTVFDIAIDFFLMFNILYFSVGGYYFLLIPIFLFSKICDTSNLRIISAYILMTVFMVLFPIVGPIFYGIYIPAWLIYQCRNWVQRSEISTKLRIKRDKVFGFMWKWATRQRTRFGFIGTFFRGTWPPPPPPAPPR